MRPGPASSDAQRPVIGAVQPLLTAIVDGVATLRADPAVDPERIGTASYSLGALAAMAAELGGAGRSTVTPLELTAAALLSYPDQLPTIPDAARAGQLPPLFSMTAEIDTVAPPAGAQALAEASVEGGVPVELVIVPDRVDEGVVNTQAPGAGHRSPLAACSTARLESPDRGRSRRCGGSPAGGQQPSA